MRKLLVAAMALGLFWPAIANAAMNLQQRSDGTADWTGAKPGGVGNCVGGHALNFQVTLNRMATDYGVVPITNAAVQSYWAIRASSIANAKVARIRVMLDAGSASATALQFRAWDGRSSFAEIQLGDGTRIGQPQTISTFAQAGSVSTSSHVRFAPHVLGQGVGLAVSSDGGADTMAGQTTSKVVVLVCPR